MSKITYSVYCSSCGKEIPMEANPQSDAEWKTLQRNINKASTTCTECQKKSAYHYDYEYE